MTGRESAEVRPTLRCVTEDLKVPLPTTDVSLASIEHPIVANAQLIPAKAAADGAERILSLADRVWLKAKSGRHRGAVTDYQSDVDEPLGRYLRAWWLGFAGWRESGSADDAYEVAQARSTVGRKNRRPLVDTSWMLPQRLDAVRVAAEMQAREEAAMFHQVRAAIAQSARSGKVLTTFYGAHSLEVLVRMPDAETYLAIGVTGVRDPREIAALLSCVPGTNASDWMPEPGAVLGFEPREGQLIYSAQIAPDALDRLLEDYPEGTLDVS